MVGRGGLWGAKMRVARSGVANNPWASWECHGAGSSTRRSPRRATERHSLGHGGGVHGSVCMRYDRGVPGTGVERDAIHTSKDTGGGQCMCRRALTHGAHAKLHAQFFTAC